VNWMNMQTLERAVRMNGVTRIVFNKVDVLRTVGGWAVYDDDKKVEFKNGEDMQTFVSERLKSLGLLPEHIYFSESKDKI